MKIIFRDLNPEVVNAVSEVFKGCENIDLDAKCESILNVAKVDAIVSPCNTTGRMDGGIDQQYLNFFPPGLQAEIYRAYSSWKYRSFTAPGIVPVGHAVTVPTHFPNIPYLISAPTMEWPPGDVSQTENAFMAMAAILGECSENFLSVIAMPGLATLTGKMAPKVFAKQMYDAYMWASDTGALWMGR
jgi:O-acetyl-ADP-ribose deacetylase (regulator of RNase III)